nr:hypothetical protein [Nanoarchaeota archaeon]
NCQLPLFGMPFTFDYGVPKFQAGQNPWKSFDEILYRKRSPFGKQSSNVIDSKLHFVGREVERM